VQVVSSRHRILSWCSNDIFQDVLDPPVIALTDIDFELKISGKSSKELWFVDFYTPWCPPCMQMMSEWRRFAKVKLYTLPVC